MDISKVTRLAELVEYEMTGDITKDDRIELQDLRTELNAIEEVE